MSDVLPYAQIDTLVAAILLRALVGNRIAEKARIPAPAIFLVGAAMASDLVPAWGYLS